VKPGARRDNAAGAARIRDVQTAHAGHPDAEECDVGLLGVDQHFRLRAVVGDAGDDEVRPQRGEPVAKILREARLVVGNDRRCPSRLVQHGQRGEEQCEKRVPDRRVDQVARDARRGSFSFASGTGRIPHTIGR